LEVIGWDERGAPRLLRRAEGMPGRTAEAASEARSGVDAAGYAYMVYEAAYASPWGTALVLCKRAQEGFWKRWGEALAAQGLEIRRYLVEDLAARGISGTDTSLSVPEIPDRASEPTLRLAEDLVEFTMFRYGTQRAEAGRQARALYAATRRIIASLAQRPLAAFMWGHSEHWHRAPALACRHAGIPTYHAEGAMFPRLSRLEHGRSLDGGHAIINRNGQYYEDFADIDRLWECVGDEPLRPVHAARIDAYIAAWRQARASKYGQPTEPLDVRSDAKPVLFVPLQIDRDASLFYAKDKLVGRAVDLVQLVADCAAPARWHIIAKRHPHDASSDGPLRALERRYEHLTIIEDANIHDLLALAECVCGINSTVLIEALCHEKPAITLGSSCFAGRGFTLDVRDAASLRRVLRSDARALRLTQKQRRRFRRFLHMMMWEGNGGNGFFVDIDNFDAARLIGTG